MRESLYRGRILELVTLDGYWEVVEHAPAVAVLAVRDGLVLLVRQRRPAVGESTWELPAGLIDPGEAPEAAARRELAEEAQLGGRLALVTAFYTSPGFTDEKVYLFEATDLAPADGEPDEDEDLELGWHEPRALWRAVREGAAATSAPTLIGLQWALARLAEAP